MLPFRPGVHVQRHSLRSGTGGPSNLSARNFPLPVGAPTGRVAPLAVGLGTLHDVQAFASHLLPLGALGWYGPNTWYPKLSELPGVAPVEIGQEQMTSSASSWRAKPGNLWLLVLLKQMPPSHWP